RRIDAEILAGRGEPRLDPAFGHLLRCALEERRAVRVQLVALAVEEEGQRRPPVALARERPVGALLDHRRKARAYPFGEEARVLDRVLGDLAQRVALAPGHAALGHAVHADEPLRRRAEDDRRLVAPA